MHRSLLPFILASFGFVMLLQADGMLLFEWQLSETVQDSQATDKVYTLAPYWQASFGLSIENSSRYYMTTSVAEGSCPIDNLKFVVRRSQNDEMLERISLGIYNSISWLFNWGWIVSLLSILYMFWFLSRYKPGTINMVPFIAIIVFICIILTLGIRLAAPNVFYQFEIIKPPDCGGRVILDAALVKVHYEMPIVLFAGICLELGALSLMFRQIKRAAMERKKSTKSVVG